MSSAIGSAVPERSPAEASFADWMRWHAARIEQALESTLPPASEQPGTLHEAMRYAVLGGGKRVRPLLVLAAGEAVGATPAALEAAGCAVELIHAYSLVHDDLPAMDDDALRRGQPTVHVAFDEATAILAGDALQALAFTTLAAAPVDDAARVAMLAELATAAGASGMCGGQAFDLAATGGRKWGQGHFPGGEVHLRPILDPENDPDPIFFLERLHTLKTGALLRAAVRLGAIAAGADAPTRRALDDYANALGLAFQIRDDLLDIEGDSATLGKTAGKDLAQDKATFPALAGVEASRARLRELAAQMDSALEAVPGDTSALAVLARRAIERDR